MKRLKRLVNGTVRFNEGLARHTSFRIGGRVEVWVEPEDVEDLRQVIKTCRKSKKPVYVIGNGSNLLVNSKKLKGVVISLSAPCFRAIKVKGQRLIAGAGMNLKEVLRFCVNNRLTGLEFCAGIPGTVGGAVAMNAANIADRVSRVTVMNRRGQVRVFNRKALRFGYRKSSIKDAIILDVELVLKKARIDSIKSSIRKNLERKRKTQELHAPSAGCVFKNPCNGLVSAGKLIELAGLKGAKIGGARISEKHANYIINAGNAKFKDVKKLIDIIRKKVKDEFSIELEPEIRIWR